MISNSGAFQYLLRVYNLYSESMRAYCAAEVIKRQTDILKFDVSYKAPNHLSKYRGEKVFKGLFTAMNQVGEVRMSAMIYTDSHEQLVNLIQSFNETNAALGMPGPSHAVTDNPSGDAAFFSRMITSLADQQQRYDTMLPPLPSKKSPLLEKLFASVEVIFIETISEINNKVNALTERIKYDAYALDCEWVVERNSHDKIIGQKKVALIQIGYYDLDDKPIVLLIHTSKFAKHYGRKVLPHRLESLLVGNDLNIVGFNVSADLNRIGRDFGVASIKSVVQNKRQNVINLGMYARERDVVTDGGAGMAEVARILKGVELEKDSKDDRFSDWEKLPFTQAQVS